MLRALPPDFLRDTPEPAGEGFVSMDDRVAGCGTRPLQRGGWGLLQTVVENEAELAPLAEREAGLESVIAVEGDVVAA
jgi:hypothetical protein